jgi:hypothetical protein
VEEVAVPSICPSGNGQQSGAALFYRVQHVVPAQGVNGIFASPPAFPAAGVSRHASPDVVPDNLAASRNANCDLYWH